MYKIINVESGDVLGMVEQPYYIRVAKNGCFVKSDKEHAQGIAFESQPYNLPNGNIKNVEQTVILKEIDTGKLFEQLKANQEFIAIMQNLELNEIPE